MNKKLEAAAIEYALDKISVKCPACDMDSLWNNHSNDFKAGAEFALREAIEQIKEDIERYAYDCQESKKYGTNSAGFNQDLGALEASKKIKEFLEQLLSSEGEK